MTVQIKAHVEIKRSLWTNPLWIHVLNVKKLKLSSCSSYKNTVTHIQTHSAQSTRAENSIEPSSLLKNSWEIQLHVFLKNSETSEKSETQTLWWTQIGAFSFPASLSIN